MNDINRTWLWYDWERKIPEKVWIWTFWTIKTIQMKIKMVYLFFIDLFVAEWLK